MGYGKGLAQEIVQYMAEFDKETLFADYDGALAIMEAYDDTMAQLQGEGWLHVAWYLVTQLRPLEGEQELMAYDLLERLFADHGID